MDINIDALYNILKQNQRDVNDAMGLKNKTVVVTFDPLALIAEKTNAFNRRKFYSKPTNNNLRTSSTSQSGNKKQEFVKTDNKKVKKKDDEKKRDMSRVKCYNYKKEGHFAKDCKKVKVKDYEYYKIKIDSDQEINENMVFMAQIEKVLSDSEASSSSADVKIFEVSYYLSESESESEYETSEYYNNTTIFGLFVNDNDDQEIFHDCENFLEYLIEFQINHNESVIDHNDSEGINKLIRKCNNKIVKCQKRIEKENQQSKDFKNQNNDLQDKYDVLKYQATTFKMNNKELNEQLKVLIEKNVDLLAQTKVLKDQLQVKHVVIDTHVECQEKYAKLEAEIYEYMIRYSAYFDNDKQHRKQIADQEVLFDKMSVQLVELDKHTVHMIMPSKDNLYNGQKGIGFENPSYFEKAKDLRPILYDIGPRYTPMFLTHSEEALEIEKFKRSRENKIEFAYDYGNLNASYVNEKINFSDDYFQEIINLDFEKIDSLFQQRSSLKPYVLNVILEKIIIDLEDEAKIKVKMIVLWLKKNVTKWRIQSHLKLNKDVKRYSRKDLLSCNNSHLRETRRAYVCNDAMNVSCNSRMCDLFDENNLFIFDGESVRISPVSKMLFRKKPRDSMNVHSKSNSNKSLPRTVHRWLPKMQQLVEPVAKWIPRVERQIDKISKTPNSSGPIYKWVPKVS
nr:hypothetical protein [Tanacetum cinerariifolium]